MESRNALLSLEGLLEEYCRGESLRLKDQAKGIAPHFQTWKPEQKPCYQERKS